MGKVRAVAVAVLLGCGLAWWNDPAAITDLSGPSAPAAGEPRRSPEQRAVDQVIAYALDQRGARYVWGGTGPDSFDCSGLIWAAYRSAGLSIPRTTFEQYPFGKQVPSGREKPGDLVFFNTGPGTSRTRPGHVGMVVSTGKMIEARCTRCGPVKVVAYTGRDKLVGIRRMITVPAVRRQLERPDG